MAGECVINGDVLVELVAIVVDSDGELGRGKLTSSCGRVGEDDVLFFELDVGVAKKHVDCFSSAVKREVDHFARNLARYYYLIQIPATC